ncbi:MAG: hypothetical protein KME08_21755 [Aphanothece sp. CMT-3BRIN-NPC111]|jgi:Tfp pilus assembly protein PilX|nr:hypothetical protein [Aphanothece sp. CMT-3BRIN-NPC111]
MNQKLKIALIRRSSEQGFAMPVALGMGLVMLLVGATMIVRSQSESATGSAQKNTSLGLSAAEAGVTKVQSFLTANRFLAVKSYPWTSSLVDASGVQCTSASGSVYNEALAFNSWQSINNGTQQFKVSSYSYQVTDSASNEGIGTLVVEGKSFQGTSATSTSRLQVKIPVQRKIVPSVAPPGSWANSFDLGGNDFVVQSVIDSGCTSSISTSQQTSNFSNPAGGGVTVVRDSSYQLGSPLPVPSQCPAAASFTNANKPCAIYVTGPVTGSSSPGTIFPSTTDITNYPAGTGTKGEYIYYISNGGGLNSINLSGGNGIVTIRPDKKVSFYLQGNLDMSGSSRLGHDCFDSVASPDGLPNNNDGDAITNYGSDGYTILDEGDRASVGGVECKATDFQIYGGAATTQVLLGGSNLLDAFIYAPNASNSGINGSAMIRGSVWLNEWDASSSNQIVVVQTGDWDNLPTSMFPPNLASIGSWERQVVP